MRHLIYCTLLIITFNCYAHDNYIIGDFDFNLDDIVPGDSIDTQETITLSNEHNHSRMRCFIDNKNATNGKNLTASAGSTSFTITVYFPRICSEGGNTLRITGNVPESADSNEIYIEDFDLSVKYRGSSDEHDDDDDDD